MKSKKLPFCIAFWQVSSRPYISYEKTSSSFICTMHYWPATHTVWLTVLYCYISIISYIIFCSRQENENNGQTLICTLEVQIIKILSWPLSCKRWEPNEQKSKRLNIFFVLFTLIDSFILFQEPYIVSKNPKCVFIIIKIGLIFRNI